MIEAALIAHLKTRPAVAAIVGTRIHASRAPQHKQSDATTHRPLLVVKLAGGNRQYHTGGASGLVESNLDMRFEGGNYAEARSLYEAVRGEVDGKKGTWAGVSVDAAFLDPPADGSGDPQHGDDVGFPALSARLIVWHFEVVE